MAYAQMLTDGHPCRFLHPLAFAASTLFAFGYFVFVVIQNTRCLGLKSPLASFARLQWPQLPKSSVERKPIN